MARSPFDDEDQVRYGELAYLQHRYPERADVEERRERINAVLKRLSKRNVNLGEVHHAFVALRLEWEGEHRRDSPEVVKLQARAGRDLARAIASLRAVATLRPLLSDEGEFLSDEEQARLTDDDILRRREVLLSARAPVRRPGRPQQKWKATEEALHRAGVGPADRLELLAAFGFISDEP